MSSKENELKLAIADESDIELKKKKLTIQMELEKIEKEYKSTCVVLKSIISKYNEQEAVLKGIDKYRFCPNPPAGLRVIERVLKTSESSKPIIIEKKPDYDVTAKHIRCSHCKSNNYLRNGQLAKRCDSCGGYIKQPLKTNTVHSQIITSLVNK